MRKHRFSVGGITVLLTVVLLCVSVLAAVTVVTALADEKTARRYGAQVQQLYGCENEGQRWLAGVREYLSGDGQLPEGTWQEGNTLGTEISQGRGKLEITLKITGQSCEILRWDYETRWQSEENWNLWAGKTGS